jgi:hypothetical protein
MDMDIPVTITAINMDIPNAVTGITDTAGATPTTDMADTSIIAGLAAIARRVINADQNATTSTRIGIR